MRILHIMQRYWPAFGGAEALAGELLARLAADGHQVTVATSDAQDFELFWDPARRRVAERQDFHDGVRIVRFPIRHVPVSQLGYPGLRRLLWALSVVRPVPVAVLHRLARFTPYVPDLWRWLARTSEPFDLVAGMTICFEPFLEAGQRFAARRGVPYVIYPLTHLGAGPQPGADPLSRFYTMRHQVRLVQASDGVVNMTPTEQRFYVAHGVPMARTVVAGPGVYPERVTGGDAARFRSRHGIRGPLVVSLSAMSYDKGTVHVVEAVRRLWQAGQTVELALAGAVLAPFRSYLDTLPAADRERIHLLGSVDEAEKQDLLAAADIFAMPSRTDSFGIVYLEAWLYEKPVIGARTWGVNDVISDGQDGLLVPFADVGMLAQAIMELIDHPAERAAMGRRGAEKVRRSYTWDCTYQPVRDLYTRLTEA